MDIQDHWVKNLSDRDLIQPKKVLAKGQLSSTTTASSVRAALSNAKIPPSNLTPKGKKAVSGST